MDDKDKNILWNELNQTLLHLAAKEGHIEIVKYLSGFLTDINPSSSSGGCNFLKSLEGFSFLESL